MVTPTGADADAPEQPQRGSRSAARAGFRLPTSSASSSPIDGTGRQSSTQRSTRPAAPRIKLCDGYEYEVAGEVSHIAVASVPRGGSAAPFTITTFTLEVYDADDGRRESVAVRASGAENIGVARDGDRVVVVGEADSGVLLAWTIRNERTGAEVHLSVKEASPSRVMKRYKRTQTIVASITLAVMALAAVVGAHFAFHTAHTASTLWGSPSATIEISPTRALAGSKIKVSGTGFDSDEAVDLRVSATHCGRGTADAHGKLAGATCLIPKEFAAFAGQSFPVTAQGHASLREDEQTVVLK